MPRHPSHRTAASWTAIVAILLGSLAPLIWHALQRDAASPWLELCTTARADAGTGSAPAAPAGGHGLDHCPCCWLHAATLGLPPAPWAGLPAVVTGVALPPLFLAAGPTLFAWSAAQPRGPPNVS